MTLALVLQTNVSLEYGNRTDRTIVGEIDLRSSIVASRCPMPVITLCVNIPASCSTLNYPLVPSVYRPSICIRSFRVERRNTIGIRPGTGGDSNLLETYRAISPSPPSTRLSLPFATFRDSKVFQTKFFFLPPSFLPSFSFSQILRIYIYVCVCVKRPSLQFLGRRIIADRFSYDRYSLGICRSTSYYFGILLFFSSRMEGKQNKKLIE